MEPDPFSVGITSHCICKYLFWNFCSGAYYKNYFNLSPERIDNFDARGRGLCRMGCFDIVVETDLEAINIFVSDFPDIFRRDNNAFDIK